MALWSVRTNRRKSWYNKLNVTLFVYLSQITEIGIRKDFAMVKEPFCQLLSPPTFRCMSIPPFFLEARFSSWIVLPKTSDVKYIFASDFYLTLHCGAFWTISVRISKDKHNVAIFNFFYHHFEQNQKRFLLLFALLWKI